VIMAIIAGTARNVWDKSRADIWSVWDSNTDFVREK